MIKENLIMKIPSSQGDINFYIPGNLDVIVKMSGGADSSLLMYLLAKYKNEYNSDINFIIVSSVAKTKPYQYIFAKRVVEFIDTIYPLGNYQHLHNDNRAGQHYCDDIESFVNSLHTSNTTQYMGITANPSVDEMKLYNLYDPDRDKDRDPGFETDIQENEIFKGVFKRNRPFAKYNKKVIKELYDVYNLTDTLFPLTRSCEKLTTDFSSHCGDCWWCKERLWAFGKLE